MSWNRWASEGSLADREGAFTVAAAVAAEA